MIRAGSPTITWRKSTYSGGESGECVELARLGRTVGIRDSKDPAAPHLAVTPAAFATLVREIKHLP
jgi:Domain of unknown function (DUF397)